MRVVVAGSRSIRQYRHVVQAIETAPFFDRIEAVVSGGAAGVDRLGEQYAESCGFDIDRFYVTAEHRARFGNRFAYLRRNELMARFADAAIIVWDGQSRGTIDMLQRAGGHSLPLHVATTKGHICLLQATGYTGSATPLTFDDQR